MRRALQAIGLLVFVFFFNFAFYVAILLITKHAIGSASSFPAWILFLSFALSIGIILIVALGERADTRTSTTNG